MPKGKDIIGFAKDKQAVMVDMKFMDFLGLWQHFTIPIAELSEAVFDEGLGFDGSSIRGWVPIHASDMLVMPDADTAQIDPFMKDTTLSLICNVVDPITKEPYARDPRYKEGYFPVAPIDSQQDLRTEMCRVMEQVGILVERQHHEVATAGQAEIDIRFDSLVRTADKLMWFKYIIKNVALRNGKTVTL